MGLETNRFLEKDTIIDCLICTICTDVIEDPVETPCQHCFCKECITRWLQGGKTSCPIDREKLTLAALKSPHRSTIQLLNKLIIRCKNYAQGCPLMARLENMSKLIEHEVDGCRVVSSNLLIDAQTEIRTLKSKITELEEELSLQKGLYSIAIEDHDKMIEEKDAKITVAENTVKQIQEMASQISVKALSVVTATKAARESSSSARATNMSVVERDLKRNKTPGNEKQSGIITS